MLRPLSTNISSGLFDWQRGTNITSLLWRSDIVKVWGHKAHCGRVREDCRAVLATWIHGNDRLADTSYCLRVLFNTNSLLKLSRDWISINSGYHKTLLRELHDVIVKTTYANYKRFSLNYVELNKFNNHLIYSNIHW